MKKRLIPGILAVLLLASTFTLLSCTQSAEPSVDIMAGSSFIANIVQDISDGELEAQALIPPGTCPGHYDVKPSEIQALANSKALFIHNYQQNYENVTGSIEAADNPDLIITVLNVTGNWMVPTVQIEGVSKIAQALSEVYPENAAYYQQRAADREQAILAHGEEVKDILEDAEVGAAKVICAEMQAGFIGWAGFNITATYGRPEDLSVTDMGQLVTDAREAGVAVVIDNLQSGATDNSETMAQDIEAIAVTISNFPGGLEDTETWEKAIDKNVDLLLAALNEWQEQYG